MVGRDSGIEKNWPVFSVAYEFNWQCPVQNWVPCGLPAVELQRVSEIWRVAESLHFCFTPIMGDVRWNRFCSPKKEEMNHVELQKQERLAAAFDSQGIWAASRNYKKQGKGFSPKPSRRNAAPLTAWLSSNETHFKLLASRTVRLFCVLKISHTNRKLIQCPNIVWINYNISTQWSIMQLLEMRNSSMNWLEWSPW